MTDLLFQLNFGNGFVNVPPPRNYLNIRTELVFTSPNPSASIKTIDFEWDGNTAKLINDYIAKGLTGGVGIYEGIPLNVIDCNINQGMDLILDTANESASFECDMVKCPIVERGAIDWLNDIAGSFGFWYLASQDFRDKFPTLSAARARGFIDHTDYKKTPYAISELPNYTQFLTTGITALAVAIEVVKTTRDVVAQIVIVLSDLTSTPFDIGVTIGDIVLLIINIALLIIEVFALINLIQQMVDCIIQAPKYKLCMREKDLFTKACQYLGLQFQSTIFEVGSAFENSTWMPEKSSILQGYSTSIIPDLTKRPYDEVNGGQSDSAYGYADGSFTEFLENMKLKYNAGITIRNGVMYFEELHYWNNKVTYKIPNEGDVGYSFNYPDPHGTNAHELPPSYFLKFQLDESELNTIHRYEGTTCMAIVKPNIIINQKHLLNADGLIVQLPFALGKRKTFLTFPETFLKAAIDSTQVLTVTITALINGINGGILGAAGTFIELAIKAAGGQNLTLTFPIPNPNWAPLEKAIRDSAIDRIGWLELSNDTFSVPKTFIGLDNGGNWYLSPLTANIQVNGATKEVAAMSAANLFDKFHSKNLATRGNQYLTYKGKKIPFCCNYFLQLLNNNVVLTTDGKYAKVTSLTWDMASNQATVDYRINERFTANLTEQIIIDGNQ